MNLLALDASTEKLSVAVSAGSETISFTADAGLRHSELVMDIIDILMKKASLKPGDLFGVVCTGGPGSFTGLRIGFTLAKGLSLALDIPFAAIPTLDCMVRPFSHWPGIAVPVIDAKKGAFFCAFYSGGKRLCPDMDATPVEIADAIAVASAQIGKGDRGSAFPLPVLLVGPGAQMLYEKIIPRSSVNPLLNIHHSPTTRPGDAVTLLEIAKEASAIEKNSAGIFAGPEYIRKSDAELGKIQN